MPKETNKKQNKEKQVKEKKHFWKDFKAELKRVIWPAPKQLINNTVAVITIVLITAVVVFALDFAFEKVNEYGIEKLKSVVETKKDNTTNNETALNEVGADGNTTNESVSNTTENNTQTNQVSENTEAK